MKKYAKFIPLVALLVAIAIVVTVFVKKNNVEVMAGGTLPGIETIVNNNSNTNPFVIVEVVPDKLKANVGYLIGGEEPLINGKAITDMPVKAEREAAMGYFDINKDGLGAFSDLLANGALGYNPTYVETETPDASSQQYIVRGYYIDAAGGDYSLIYTAAVFVPWSSVGDPSAQKYSKYLDFAAGTDCGITLGYIIDNTYMSIVDGGDTYPISEKYSVTAISLAGISADDAKTYVNSNVFVGYIDGAPGADPYKPVYEYAGKIGLDAVGDAVFVDVFGNDNVIDTYIDPSSQYYVLNLVSDSLGGDYAIRGFSSGYTNGAYTKHFHYEMNSSETDENAYAIYSEATGNVDYTPGTGNRSFIPSYSSQVADIAIFNGGITNNEWIKKNVFDLSDANSINTFKIDVKTVTPSEFNAMGLDGVDMVYFSAGYYAEELTEEMAQAVVSQAINGMPIVLEAGYDQDCSLSNRPNNYKLRTVLRQSGIKHMDYSTIISGWNNADYWTNSSTGLSNTQHSMDGANTIYVDNNVLVSWYDKFFSGNFLARVSDALIGEGGGLLPVKTEIDSENFYRLNAGTATISNVINKAAAVRYIINFSNQRVVVKNAINVLEIEPCFSFSNYVLTGNSNNSLLRTVNPENGNIVNVTNINRRVLDVSYIANNWATQFKDSLSNIKLTQTYTKEFIGKVEDLNENYDLIYIGLDTSTLPTRISGNEKTRYTWFKDDKLRGKIYTHVGDIIEDTTGWSSLLGWIANKESTSKLYWDDERYHKFNNRLSGNDITASKLKELEQYITAGYPIIFADDFFHCYDSGMPYEVNTDVIDIDSNMYLLGQFCLGLYDGTLNYFSYNAFVDKYVTNNLDFRNRLAEYLNLSKLSVKMLNKPVEYTNTAGTPSYLLKTGGKYVLDYEFSIKNDAAVSVYSTTYDVALLIDTSVDGRFSTLTEQIPSLEVYEVAYGTENRIYPSASGHYELMAGKQYHLRRDVPTGYVGVLPWKLVFTQNDNANIRKSVSGYTAVPITSSDRQTIKVLQITTAEGRNNLNLKDNANVRNLLNQVQDFNVVIEVINSAELLASRNSESEYLAFLNTFDMLIFGFSDMYEFGTKNQQSRANTCAMALRTYIKSGKSVLFTHDTTSFFNRNANWIDGLGDIVDGLFSTTTFKSYWGYSFNRYIRDIVGMDRYNALNKTGVFDTYSRTNAKMDDLTQGYSDIILQRFNDNSNSRGSSRPVFYANSEDTRGGNISTGSYTAQRVNMGQITKYPFDIPESISIANTHGQYYQLNMDTFPDDSITDDDVVVWYTISDINGAATDDIYQANYNDVRNNYYIYNIGNVMYSGVGHSENITTNELKLFINTMVAAYQSGVHPPAISYRSGETNPYEVETTYLPYDEALHQFIDTTDLNFYFEISDSSFIQGVREVSNHFYVEDESGTKTITYNGESVKVREINPVITANGTNVSNIHALDLDKLYCMTVSVTDITDTNGNLVRLFISAKTKYKLASNKELESTEGFYAMKVIRTELFDLK